MRGHRQLPPAQDILLPAHRSWWWSWIPLEAKANCQMASTSCPVDVWYGIRETLLEYEAKNQVEAEEEPEEQEEEQEEQYREDDDMADLWGHNLSVMI